MEGDDPVERQLALHGSPGGLPERLTPVEHGWPIRWAYGSSTWRLAPPRAQPFVRVLSWVPSVGLFGGIVSLYLAVGRGHWFLPWYLLIKGGVFKVGLVAGAGAALARFWGRMNGFFLRRAAVLYSGASWRRAPRHGALARVVGTVGNGPCFRSAVSGEPAVLVHYEIVPHGTEDASVHTERQSEVRGIDFSIDSDRGEEVLICTRDVFMTEKPAGDVRAPANLTVLAAPPGGIFREARIAPGDRVEAIGVLSYEMDPDGQRAHPRDIPRRLTLRGTRRFPLLLRKVRAPRAARSRGT
jgi:hypothetical protein